MCRCDNMIMNFKLRAELNRKTTVQECDEQCLIEEQMPETKKYN